jgi:aspartate oxidase
MISSKIMWNHAGIVRSAQTRRESRGPHYRRDWPARAASAR